MTTDLLAYRANRSVGDAVNVGLHYILQHLDHPGTCAGILFVDFRSAFNTIVPQTLCSKLRSVSGSTAPLLSVSSRMVTSASLGGGSAGALVQSEQPGAEHTQDCGDDSGLLDFHSPRQPCVHRGQLEIPGHSHLSGSEVGAEGQLQLSASNFILGHYNS